MLPSSGTTASLPSGKRKVVCSGCRLRKKKCDGLRPSCSACHKWNEHCDYTPISALRQQSNSQTAEGSTGAEPLFPTGPFNWDLDIANAFPQGPMPNQSYAALQSLLPTDIQIPPPSLGIESVSPPLPTAASFPRQDQIIELAEIFFKYFHCFLPFMHRESFLEKIKSQELAARAPALLYAILTISARSHADPAIQAQQEVWFGRAKSLYAEAEHDPRQPLQIIQAAACIILHSQLVGDYSTAWLMMGKSWRQAAAVGFHRVDSEDSLTNLAQTPIAGSLRDKEEQRRTMWTLFILDRGMCFPLGLPHAIDDRQLVINLPLGDHIFQGAGSLSQELTTKRLFTRNFTRLVTSVQADPNDPSPDLFQFIIVSYVLLGRIVEHTQTTHKFTDRDDYESEFKALDTDLIRVRLSIPRSASFLPTATADNQSHVVWLNAVTNSCAILLHNSFNPLPRPSQTTLNGSSTSSFEPTSGLGEHLIHWSHCLTAARNTVGLVKDASRVSMEMLLNPHISRFFYLSGRIITLEYLESKFASNSQQLNNSQQSIGLQDRTSHQSLRTEIDFLLLLFDRLTEVFREVGAKLKASLLRDLDQDAETVSRVKAGGVKTMMTACPGWLAQAREPRQIF